MITFGASLIKNNKNRKLFVTMEDYIKNSELKFRPCISELNPHLYLIITCNTKKRKKKRNFLSRVSESPTPRPRK